MATPLPCRLAVLVTLVIGLAVAPAAGQPRPLDVLAHAARAPRALGAPPTLAVTFNNAGQAAGTTLVAGVSVDNPGSGPLADFYFLIVLPDGTTVVSTGPGLGARFGTLANLRTLVPVARSISLASAFPFQSANFFSYTFTGAEPQGVYLVYFVALTAGALNDGAIGAGELVALASRTFSVGPTGAPQVDTGRRVGATIGAAGGSVQTSTAAGVGLRLTVPVRSVPAATAITIAPLTAFNDLAIGPLVAGVRAEPSGLRFTTPATLSITLPAGFQVPAFGLKGFVADSDGRNLEIVPVSIVGNVATLPVSHFSVAGVGLNSNPTDIVCVSVAPPSPQQQAACAALVPLYDAEQRRLETQGGPVSAAFTSAWLEIMRTWVETGILPRLTAARFPTGDPASEMLDAGFEWLTFQTLYRDLFPLEDRTNDRAGQPLGMLIDQVQNQLVRDLPLRIVAVNQACLADKANVAQFANQVAALANMWDHMHVGPAPFTVTYCADIDIQASPVPVLVPGTPASMLLDIRLRFSDGQELPSGITLSVVITATDATVSPAGGILSTPVIATVAITPVATSSTITIRAAVAEPDVASGFNSLPPRTATVFAGNVRFSDATFLVRSEITDNFVNPTEARDQLTAFTTQDRVAVTLPPMTFGTSGAGYTARASVSATRTVTSAPDGLVVSMTASTEAVIALDGTPSRNGNVRSIVSDGYEVLLRQPFDVTPALSGGTLFFSPAGMPTVAAVPGVTIRLPAGRNFVQFDGGIRRLYQGSTPGQPPLIGETSGTHSYSLVFRAVP